VVSFRPQGIDRLRLSRLWQITGIGGPPIGGRSFHDVRRESAFDLVER
jgi:hypothetical protein